jgi:O-antigen/teichoic acid export membrane protein
VLTHFYSLNKIKKLAGQTLVYGMSTILVRALAWLIAPFHTHVFHPSDYGIISELYAYVAFINVIFMYGMETAFFRFATKSKDDADKIFSTAMYSLLVTTSFFVAVLWMFSGKLAEALQYPDMGFMVVMLAFIMGLDALANIPFAKLRLEGKPLQYVFVKAFNVVVYVLLNIFFLYPLFKGADSFELAGMTIDRKTGIYFVFVANLIASIGTLLLFIPQFLKQQWSFCNDTWKQMMKYGLPFVIVGLAGIVNETLDRVLLKYLLPYDTQEERLAQLGIYSAAYKLSIFMNLVVQAFRMGAEPFFFKQSGEKDAKEVYAQVMHYFVILGLFVFLGVSFNLDWLILLLGEKYHAGKTVVPIVLMAYLFLGIYYNLSVWYKLTDKTFNATFISIAGALITIIFNVIFIPKIGFYASAWATLLAYVGMSLISYFWGRKYYPVDYPFSRMSGYFFLALLLFALSEIINVPSIYLSLTINNLLLLVFAAFAFYFDLYKFGKSKGPRP